MSRAMDLSDAKPHAELADLTQTDSIESRPVVASADGQTVPSYLLVIDGQVAYRFALPRRGELLIGRAPDVSLRLSDSSASRQHARIDVGGDDVWISDLGSRNGTRINGEILTETRMLLTGDVISICTATLVFQRDSRVSAIRPFFDAMQLRQRLREEADRAQRYGRHLSLICLHCLSSGALQRSGVVNALQGLLRTMDVAAWIGTSSLMVMLPELDAAAASAQGQRFYRALIPLGIDMRMGVVSLPADGTDVESLLTACQSAATTASTPGVVVSVEQTASILEVGDQRVVLVDPAMKRIYALVEKLAKTEFPVLIGGETGVGKEAAARTLHHLSARKEQPLLVLNCAAFSDTLAESELFGHERGAFSGAVNSKQGLLESASGGTIILDEVGEMSLTIQAKLLRVLEANKLRRVGDVRERSIDVRVVAVTNRDLQAEVQAGRFRQDLYFRLSAARVTLPSLRDRPRELPVLARMLLEEACDQCGRAPMEITPAAMHRMLSYRWPGNVRELRNLMHFVSAAVEESQLQLAHIEDYLQSAPLTPSDTSQSARGCVGAPRSLIPEAVLTPEQSGIAASSPERVTVAPSKVPAEVSASEASAGGRRTFRPIEQEIRELERRRMLEALASCGGVQVRAAELLAMPARTFTAKMKQYNISARSPARREDGRS